MKQPSLKSKPFLKFLTQRELENLATNRLLGVLNSVRAVEHSTQWKNESRSVCCEICNDWILGAEMYKKHVTEPTAHLTAYKNRVREELSKREHIE